MVVPVVCALLLGLLVASANWVGAGVLLGVVVGIAMFLAGPRTLLVLLLAGSPTFFVVLNNYLHVIPVLTMERVLFGVLTVALLARIATDKSTTTPLIPAEYWIFGFLAVALAVLMPAALSRPITQFLSKDAGLYVQTYFMPFVAFALARRISWSETQASVLGKWLLVAGVVLCGNGLAQLFFGITTFSPTYMTTIHLSEDRATGVFNNATEFGMAMTAFFLVALLFAVRSKDALMRLFLSALAVVMVAGVLLSKTRAAWVGFVASVLFLYVADRRLRPFFVLCAALAGIALTLALPILIDSELFQQRVGTVAPVFNRLAGWATAVNMILHNPLFGVGFERSAFGVHIRDYLVGFGPATAQWATVLASPHNEHLNVAVLTGLVGFSLYVGVFVSVFRLLRSICRRHAPGDLPHDAAIYSGALLTSFLVNGLFVDFGPNIYVGLLTFACLGLVASWAAEHAVPDRAPLSANGKPVPLARETNREPRANKAL